jgi:hypothetical protein
MPVPERSYEEVDQILDRMEAGLQASLDGKFDEWFDRTFPETTSTSSAPVKTTPRPKLAPATS